MNTEEICREKLSKFSLLNPKLNRIESYLALYFLFVPTVWMVFKLGNPSYNPFLLVFDGPLSTVANEDLGWSTLKGILLLIIGHVATAILAFRYIRKPENQVYKKWIIGLIIVGVLEYYYRGGIAYLMSDDLASTEMATFYFLPVAIFSICNGALFITFARQILKRNEQILPVICKK